MEMGGGRWRWGEVDADGGRYMEMGGGRWRWGGGGIWRWGEVDGDGGEVDGKEYR